MRDVIYSRTLESPAVVESAAVRDRNYKARIEGRGPTLHKDTAVSYRTRTIEHTLREVPPSGYFIRKDTGTNQIELCAAKRDGTPSGTPFRCPRTFYESVVRDRRIFPVLLGGSVYHLPAYQWKILRSILLRDGLEPLKGKTFHSLSELAAATERPQ